MLYKLLILGLAYPLLLCAKDESSMPADSSRWIEYNLYCDPIRMEDLDGSRIANLKKHPRATPLLFPKIVSPFEWIDRGEIEFHSLDDLIENPMLREVLPKFKTKHKSPFVNNHFSSNRTRTVFAQPESADGLDIQRLIQPKAPLPDDQKLLAFLKQGTIDLSIEEKTKILESLIPKDTDKDLIKNLLRPSRNPETEQIASSSTPAVSTPADFPELPEIPSLDLPLPPAGFETSTSPADPGKTVLKLRASKATTDGSLQPVQASDFYLTTQNLQDLFKDLDADELLAGEVQSVAELWAKAEKSSNQEVVVGVKSILLQAKVGKARTDAFGQAALEDLTPDEKYYLIGIEKDDLTDVVTIWSKEIEVSPGENMIELSSNDVIYQE